MDTWNTKITVHSSREQKLVFNMKKIKSLLNFFYITFIKFFIFSQFFKYKIYFYICVAEVPTAHNNYMADTK